MSQAAVDRADIHDELERVRATFHALLGRASPADLRRRSAGTHWINAQLLFHIAFGYLVVRRLLPLVRLFGRVPDRYSRVFARVLDAGTAGDVAAATDSTAGSPYNFTTELMAVGPSSG